MKYIAIATPTPGAHRLTLVIPESMRTPKEVPTEEQLFRQRYTWLRNKFRRQLSPR
jgi:hypothetical protein